MEQETGYQTWQSPHFHIRYRPDSFADRDLVRLTGRLETAWAAIAEVLHLEDGEPITVTLVDYRAETVPVPGDGDTPLQGNRAILEVYRPEVPAPGLERSLLLVALASVADRPPVPFLLDGLLACIARRLPGGAARDQTARLGEARRAGEIPPLVSLFLGPKPATQQLYHPAALSFVDFLLRKYGPDRLKQFVRLLRPGQGPAAAQTAFGCSLVSLEKDWHTSLGRAGGGNVRFVTLIAPYLKPYRLQMAEIFICVLLIVAFTIGFARVQGILLDRALIPRNGHVLAIIMIALISAFIVVLLAQVRASYLVAFVSGSVVRQLQLRMFTLVQRLELGFFHDMSTGDILARMSTDLDQVRSGLPIVLAQGIRMTLTIVAAVITVFLLNWRLACLSLVAIPLLALTGRVFGPRAARASMQRQRKLARAMTTLQEDLGAQPVVKAFGLEEWAERRYAQDQIEVFRAAVRLIFITGLSSATYASIGSLTQLGVMGLGGVLVVQHQLTAGTLVAFLALMAQVIGPMQNLSTILQTLQQASGGMERVYGLLTATPRIADDPRARDIARLSSSIILEDVSFSYTGVELALQHVSLEIPAGSTVAVVGPSGCGKTTLLNLIMRFYDPVTGCVRFDGVDIREASLASVRGQIGVVLQDNVLFDISIRENIRLGNLAATDEKVEAAARAAEIHDTIMSMPQGYDTPAGEHGSELSGGQRQRVAIARAIVRNPSILVLDEATSALDARTEAAVTETLTRVGQGRIIINVTHRLVTSARADQIVVLDHGKVMEQGTHAELLARDGVYAGMWREQMSMAAEERSQTDIAAERLRAIPIFAQLPPRLVTRLAAQLHVKRYGVGDTIIQEGAIGDEMYIIRKGQVEVLGSIPAGGRRRLSVLAEGQHFGEAALLRDAPRVVTVKARTPLELYTLSKEDFLGLLAAEPELRQTLARTMAAHDQKATGLSASVAIPDKPD